MTPAPGPLYLPPRDYPALIDRTQQAADAWSGAALALVILFCLMVLV